MKKEKIIMKHIELSDLNHRMLIEKMREDLRALEKNMDILYTSGSEQKIGRAHV